METSTGIGASGQTIHSGNSEVSNPLCLSLSLITYFNAIVSANFSVVVISSHLSEVIFSKIRINIQVTPPNSKKSFGKSHQSNCYTNPIV